MTADDAHDSWAQREREREISALGHPLLKRVLATNFWLRNIKAAFIVEVQLYVLGLIV
jgi:hypothetical protein